MLKVISWFSHSLESQDGKASSRKLTLFVTVTLMIAAQIVYLSKVTEPYYLLLLVVTDMLFCLMIWRDISLKDIAYLKSAISSEETKKEEAENG